MIKNIFYSFFLLSLVFSCGKTEDNSDDIEKEQVLVDGEFNYYIKNIKEKLKKYNVSEHKINKIDDVTIVFGDIHRKNGKDHVAGFCVVKYTKKTVYSQKITIDISQWRTFTDKYRTDIIAHELGHCAWGLKHDHTEDQIMSEKLTDIIETKWHIFADQIMKSSENIRNI